MHGKDGMTCPGQQTEIGEGAVVGEAEVEVEAEVEGGRRQQWGL